MQKALAKLTGDTQKAAADVDAAFGKAPPQIDNVAKSLGKTRFETANLAAQFQDIAVQLQGGQSPFTIALQQGTQISQVLGQQGAGGVVGLLGSAFKSLLSPVSLATIGVIALGGFAVKYGLEAIGAIDHLDDKLKAHGEAIKALKDAYGEAGKGVDTAVHEAAAVLKTLLDFKTDDIKKEFTSLSASISRSLTDVKTNDLAPGIIGLGPIVLENSRKFAAFSDIITTFKESVKNGTPDVLAFRRAIQQIADSASDEKTRKLADELLKMTEKAGTAQLAIEGTSKALRGFGAASLQAAEQGEAFSKAMNALGSTVTPNLDDRQKIMKNYSDALEKAGGTEERRAVEQVRNDQLAILSANERKKSGEDASKSAESAAKRFSGALDSVAKHNAQVKGQVEALGQGAGAIARLETEYRLTEQAQQSFGKVTDETRTKIKTQADDAGAAADALAKARIAVSTDFNIKTAFLTSEDLQIAQQLRGIYGNDIPTALGSAEAAGIRTANALRQISQIGQDINRGLFTDFTQQIRNGASAMDALQTAGVNALGKIADKLAGMAADNLWKAAFGGGGGGLNLFSLLGGGGTAAPTMGLGGLPAMYASGTDFARGGLSIVGEKGPELLNIPRGSQVIPNDVLRQGGGVGDITVGGATVVIQGDASEKTVALIKAALRQHDASLQPKIVAAVTLAKKQRQLA